MSSLKEKETKQRSKQKELCQPPSGPTSASPGTWLTDAYINGLEAEHSSEAYEMALAILESYRPGPRYRTLRIPITNPGQTWEKEVPATAFHLCKPELETRSICYATADVQALKADDVAAGFTMIGQTGVLSGVDLMVHRWNKDRDAELEDGLLRTKVQEDGEGRKDAEPKPKFRRVAMETVQDRYDAWFDEPSDVNAVALWENLYGLLQGRIIADRTEDGSALWDYHRYEEFLNEFVAELSELLIRKRNASERIGSLRNYLNRAWKRRRIDASRNLRKYKYFHPWSHFDAGEDQDEEYGNAFSLDDKRDYSLAMMHQRDPTPLPRSEEEVLLTRETALLSLPADLRDLVALRLAGMKERQISERLGISRQAVGRLKVKAGAALTQAMQIVQAA